MKKFGKINKKKQKYLRSRRFYLLEPGEATFKVGGEAAGISGKITGGDGEPVVGNDLFIAGVDKQVVFDDERGLEFRPTDMEP